MNKKEMIEVEVRCYNKDCNYTEKRVREKNTSYDGLKCPNCEEPMTDLGEDNE